mgnify:CR=1 FL=1
MKKGTYVLIIFLIFFFLIIATMASFVYLEFGKAPSIKANSYLELNLSGKLEERAAVDFFSTLFLGKKPLSMYEIWMNIKKARVDKRIKCLILHLGYIQCDWAKINELRDIILDFKESGKKVYAVIDEAVDFDKEYYLATACNHIILQPMGSLVINGIGGYVPFFKRSLDKLGIEAEVEHVEEYKTAYNMFTEEGFTPAHRQMMESLYGNIFSNYVKVIAQARGKSEEEIKTIINHGYFQGENAKESGLVDECFYEDEIENLITGQGEKISRITHEQYLKIKPSSVGINKGKKIALIYGTGTIHTGESMYNTMGSTTIARWLKKARKDRSVSAVVFRVDSPGGSVVASDIIAREVALTKKEKPIIVSMSDVAGSGGYWVSLPANKIIAQPQTLTGSIGVIFGKFNLVNLYKKLGITSERLIYGERADIFSPFRRLTPEERSLLKKEIIWSYDKFLTKVSENRNMGKEEVDRIGKGRVWTGSQAKELGLIDEIGGLSRAIELAKEMAGIPAGEGVKLVVWPKKISLLDFLFGKKLVKSNLLYESSLKKMISALELFERETIWAIMPFWFAPE